MIHPILTHHLAAAHIDDLRRSVAKQRRLDFNPTTAKLTNNRWTLASKGRFTHASRSAAM